MNLARARERDLRTIARPKLSDIRVLPSSAETADEIGTPTRKQMFPGWERALPATGKLRPTEADIRAGDVP